MTQVNNAFGYDYFDNPDGNGYQGYTEQYNGDYSSINWKECADYCQSLNISSALDLGCAKGYLVKALISSGISAKGYDISEYALSFTNGLPCYKYDIRNGIIEKAEAIFALSVLLYIEENELVQVMKSIYYATEKIFLFSSYYDEEKQNIPDSLRRITRSYLWWRSQIEQTGFRFLSKEKYFDVYQK
jgi:predicted TPR repeat methyltransferase